MRVVSQQAAPHDDLSQRWWQLVPISLTLIVLTLNWFVVAAAFPQLGQELHLDVSQLSNLIGIFILGFAIMHVPAGILAYSIGVKKTLLIGLFLESAVGCLCALTPNYGVLLFMRLIAGLGAGMFVNMSFALITSWFRGKELELAMGLSAATSFSIGQALALLGWIPVIQLMGWRPAILLAGGLGLCVWLLCLIFLRVPHGEAKQLSGDLHVEWRAVSHRVFLNRDLWLVGLSFFGVYGAGLLTAQLLPTYLGEVYHMSADLGARYAAGFVLLSIPGSLLGGYLAHRFHWLKAIFVWPWVLLGASVCIFPFLGLPGVWLVIVIAGAGQQFGFSAWSTMPGRYSDHLRAEDMATAEGLILTVGGLGGFMIPVIFGFLQTHFGFPGAFLFAGIASMAFALIGLAAREPMHSTAKAMMDTKRGIPDPLLENVNA